VSRERADPRLVAALTRSPGFRAELTAGLDTSQKQPSKGVNRKLDNDHTLFALFQDFLTHVADDDEDDCNEDGEEDEDDEGNVDTSWIDRWIDKPAGERGRKHTETRPGWGQLDILNTAGITVCQYDRYMVSFSFLQLSSLTLFHPEIRALSVRPLPRHHKVLQQQPYYSPG